MTRFVLIIALFCSVSSLWAQDVITKLNGEEVEAIVIEVSSTEIRFKKFDNQGGPDYVLLVSEVSKITYQNGSVETFMGIEDDYVSNFGPEVPSDNGEINLSLKGAKDAGTYYTRYKPAGTTTLLLTLLYVPVGLIPAIGCSATSPAEHNLGYPNDKLWANYEYRTAYQKEAKKIKQRKVWTNFGIAVAVNIVVFAAISAGQ